MLVGVVGAALLVAVVLPGIAVVLGAVEDAGAGSATGDDDVDDVADVDGTDVDVGDVVDDDGAVDDPSDGDVVLPGGSAVSDGEVTVVSDDVGDELGESDVDVSELGVASSTGTGNQVNGDEGRAGNGSPGARVAAGSCSTTL